MASYHWFEARNISCFKNGYEVIKNLNLDLRSDENIVLIGPNGAGKSSIIELINRNIYPVIKEKTSLRIFNKEHLNIWELREKISTVNNDIKMRINPKLKVFDLITSGLYGSYSKVNCKSEKNFLSVEELLKNMNLIDLSQKCYSHLSEGQKQIVLIARALINNPEILILDEPIANLDIKSRFYVIDQINKLSKINTKIICTTHDLSMITNIFDRIIMIKDRKIIADGTQREVINRDNINNLFDINIDVIKYRDQWNVYRNTK